MSGVRLSRALLPHMLKQNWGRIVFISSESGMQIPAEMVHYGMTKTAQLAICRGIAESVAGLRRHGECRAAGSNAARKALSISWPRSRRAARHQPRRRWKPSSSSTLRPSSLIRRMAEPDEVANLVVYLCGEPASATTGASLRVDGGVVRTIA